MVIQRASHPWNEYFVRGLISVYQVRIWISYTLQVTDSPKCPKINQRVPCLVKQIDITTTSFRMCLFALFLLASLLHHIFTKNIMLEKEMDYLCAAPLFSCQETGCGDREVIMCHAFLHQSHASKAIQYFVPRVLNDVKKCESFYFLLYK